MKTQHKNNEGFTLVELSIVIVIIGLLIGGVVAGKDLVQAAKLHSDISKFKEYKMAYSMFRDQYNAVPGDMKNATAYWPSAAGNGDGNKLIQGANEPFLVWHHLTRAKLISGTFNGTTDTPHPSIAKDNLLEAAMYAGGSTWGLHAWGAVNAIYIQNPGWQVISTADAFAIDTKMDDGVPTKGKVTGWSSPVNDSIKQSNGTTDADFNTYTGVGSYNLSSTAGKCSIAIWLPR